MLHLLWDEIIWVDCWWECLFVKIITDRVTCILKNLPDFFQLNITILCIPRGLCSYLGSRHAWLPWVTTFFLGWLENLLFSCKLKCWAPRISWLGTFWLLEFALDYSFVVHSHKKFHFITILIFCTFRSNNFQQSWSLVIYNYQFQTMKIHAACLSSFDSSSYAHDSVPFTWKMLQGQEVYTISCWSCNLFSSRGQILDVTKSRFELDF